MLTGVLGKALRSRNSVVAGGGAVTTLSPTFKNSHVTLTGSNLVATGEDGWGEQGARSIGVRSPSGKLSMTISSWGSLAQLSFGLCNATPDFTGNPRPGISDNNGIGLIIVTGGASLYRNSTADFLDWSGSPVAGNTFDMEYNDGTDTVNIYRNGALIMTRNWAPDAFTYGWVSMRNSDTLTTNFALF